LYSADIVQEKITFPERQLHSECSNNGASADGVGSADPVAAGPLQAVPDKNEFASFHGDKLDRLASEVLAQAKHESGY
jgi:hypothetical protein